MLNDGEIDHVARCMFDGANGNRGRPRRRRPLHEKERAIDTVQDIASSPWRDFAGEATAMAKCPRSTAAGRAWSAVASSQKIFCRFVSLTGPPSTLTSTSATFSEFALWRRASWRARAFGAGNCFLPSRHWRHSLRSTHRLLGAGTGSLWRLALVGGSDSASDATKYPLARFPRGLEVSAPGLAAPLQGGFITGLLKKSRGAKHAAHRTHAVWRVFRFTSP